MVRIYIYVDLYHAIIHSFDSTISMLRYCQIEDLTQLHTELASNLYYIRSISARSNIYFACPFITPLVCPFVIALALLSPVETNLPCSSNRLTSPDHSALCRARAICITLTPKPKGSGTAESCRMLSMNSCASVANACSNLCQYSSWTSWLTPRLSHKTTLSARGTKLTVIFPSVPITSVLTSCPWACVREQ